MQSINNIQQLLIGLMREASFNSFDGDFVADSLIEHRDLWRGFLIDHDDLIKLRDLPDECWNVDTLWILPALGKEDAIEQLARDQWHADEVDWIGGEEACGLLGSYSSTTRKNPRAILRCWWD